MYLILTVFSIVCVLCELRQYDSDQDLIHLIKGFTHTDVFDSYNHITDLEAYPNVCDDYDNEKCAKSWLEEMDIIRKRNSNRLSNLNYQYNSNINKKNAQLRLRFQQQNINIYRDYKKKLLKFQWRKFKSPRIRRIFKLLTPSNESKNKTISKVLINITMKIKYIYGNGRPCYGTCLTKGESGIVELFRAEKDYDKLAGYWSAWRDVTGRKIKDLFVQRMNLENIASKENGHADAASFGLKESFEESNFNETVGRLYEEILPLYKQLHGYVRFCLAKFYPGRFNKTGPIPAHILGNVWAQQWQNILPILAACQGKGSTYNIQDEANKNLQTLSVNKMFLMAEKFYVSIGMYKMTPMFWERSVIKQPFGRLIDCHGSAQNFANGKDFRILMCTKQNVNDFTTIHHEMGHIEYYMAYRHLPYALQGSANPGFHEAVGDTIALSVKTPEHLKKIGLIPDVPTSSDFDINYLLSTALEKVAFLPFALTMDSYIWSVYNGSVPYDQLNQHWWKLRYRYQGLMPPVERTENDFDPAAKYHIAFGRSYIRYFASFIHQFQFYEAMCKISKHSGPLHRCDFYGSKPAGRRLLKMLKKGESQHWRESLAILTGSRDISSKSLMKYFDPLYKWLKNTNERLHIPIGW